MKQTLSLIAILITFTATAQRKLSISDLDQTSLQNNGYIVHQNHIKGYYLFAQNDRLSKDTNSYTLHVMDENLNKVKEIRFEAENSIQIREAACNDSTLAFLFFHPLTFKAEVRIYGFNGKLKQQYVRHYSKGFGKPGLSDHVVHKPGHANISLHDAGLHGYIVIYSLKERSIYGYEMNYYDSEDKKSWKLSSPMEKRFKHHAEILAQTDSVFLVKTVRTRSSRKYAVKLTAYNIYNKKKKFDINESREKYNMLPIAASFMPGTDTVLVTGRYFRKNAKVRRHSSEGIAFYKADKKGRIQDRTYNAWGAEINRYLQTNTKGKSRKQGYFYPHEAIAGPDGKTFIVCEGYKKSFWPGGFVLSTVLLPLTRNIYMTKISATDVVVMEFNDKHKLTRANVYDKKDKTKGWNTTFVSTHNFANMMQETRSFDYRFTTGVGDHKHFSICYIDHKKKSRKEGSYYNILRYNGNKFRKDELLLKEKTGNTTVLPAKPGFLMIMEYKTKENKMDMRLEKIS